MKLLLAAALLLAGAPSLRAQDGDELVWRDALELGIEGRGWSEVAQPYDRLPARAQGIVRPEVWSLAKHSAGMAVRFRTDASEIHARWSLSFPVLEMPHMPATGVSGVDLYVRHEGAWRWLANGQPTQFPTNTAALAKGLDPGEREYLLYLPLYNGVKSVEIGVKASASWKCGSRPALEKPIVFYGTSITQGACASRPGMAHAAILGRWLDAPTINLGFSGNGTMDAELADLLAELDPSIYVIDCLPNMVAAEVTERTIPFVRRLRAARPDVPILLVEDRTYGDAFLIESRRVRNRNSRSALRTEYEKLVAAGVSGLAYLEGGALLGDDGEATVDASHPTDLGFLRQARRFREVLEPLLGRGAPGRAGAATPR